jgi:hypothetical protein
MSKQCALVNTQTNEVANIVMGSKDMWCPEDHILVEDPPMWVAPGTKWDGTDFVEPPPPEVPDHAKFKTEDL